MNFKKVFIWILIFFSIFSYFPITNAIEIKILPTTTSVISKDDKEINRKDFFIFLADYYKEDVPKTYKYIKLNFKDVWLDEKLKESLQILVYLDILENKDMKLYPTKTLNAFLFYNFIDTKLDVYANPDSETEDNLKKRNTKVSDLKNVRSELIDLEESINSEEESNKNLSLKQKIFTDVYETILNSHYDKDKLSEEKLINSAIEWLTKWTDDKFTTYFPPSESKDFEEDLNGKYEWIWAYVDMEVPWEFKIISPISDTPAEKAWLKWWDIVTHVNWKEVTKDNTLNEVVSWVKWPAWTKVTLTIKRWDEVFDLDIERAKIIIKEVDYEVLNRTTYYIQIRTFWDTVKSEFEWVLNDLKSNDNITTVILDLRNNPWWYLDQVTDMLGYFIPENEPTAIVKYKDYSVSYKSKWYDLIDFSKYKLIILQNWWTASASEIMIWTIKDYLPDTVLLWEKTYWKWSVQTIRPYSDWSSLKYTIAKWFTGKTETWIDTVWISPTVETKLDEEKYKEWYDSQLQDAIRLAK